MRSVWGCTPASSAATEITNSARVSGRSIVTPAPRATRARRLVGSRCAGVAVAVEHGGERLDGSSLFGGELPWHLDVEGHEQGAAVDAAVRHAHRLARRGPRRDTDRHTLTVEG